MKRIEEHTYEKQQFIGEDFRASAFLSVTFKNCMFSECKVEGMRLQDVVFEGCKIVGVGFHLCDQNPFFTFKAKDTIFMGCNFAGCKMKGFKAIDCRFEGCHFSETNLEEAVFTGSIFRESPMHHCDLRKADFQGVEGYSIDPRVNKIQKAKFSLPEAVTLLQCFDIKIS